MKKISDLPSGTASPNDEIPANQAGVTRKVLMSEIDPWTYVKVAGSDFTTSAIVASDITGLAFTPLASKNYEFEAVLMLRTAATATVPRIGLAWPTGLSDGVAQIRFGTGATTVPNHASGNPLLALLTGVGSLGSTTGSWPGFVSGMIMAGATPTGSLSVQLASETSGILVTCRLGSFLRYRVIP